MHGTDIRRGAAPAPFPGNLPGLTSVRFVLALGVVLFHYQLQWSWKAIEVTGLLERARLGVDVFFILSGFVLTHAYRDALVERRMHYRRFLSARFARIYPAHLAVLVFVLLMVSVADLLGAEFDRDLYNGPGLLMTLLLVHAWGPDVITAEWNGPSWSLSAEWFAYLAFPVFAAVGLLLRGRPLVFLGVSAALFVGVDQLYQTLFGDFAVHAEANMGILRIIPEFLYGIALYRLGEKIPGRRSWSIAASIVSGAVLVALMHFQADDRVIVAAAGPLVLSLALLSKAQSDAAIAKPWMLVGGEASYALYLVHFPLLIGWKGVVSAVSGKESTYILAWWEIAMLLPLTFAAALALHYLVEVPTRRWIRHQTDAAWPVRLATRTMTPGSQPPDV